VQRATLGEICICKVSRHGEVLREARHRLELCEQADRQIPIDLPEMDPQEFMRWCHVQLRAKVRPSLSRLAVGVGSLSL